MEIKTKTVFENISVNDAGMGVIITKRVDEEYARKYAHLYADGQPVMLGTSPAH